MLAGYAALGVRVDHLLAASVMAIPGGLLFAKLLVPTTERSRIRTLAVPFGDRRAANVFEAILVGTTSGVRMAVAVGAMLVAFIGLISCLNGLVGLLGAAAGLPGLSLQRLLSAGFAPVAWLTGVSWREALPVGGLIGQKLVFNEFVGFGQLSPRAVAIASFALCGFANLSSIGILLAGHGAVAPERRAEMARLGLRAVLAGTPSNLMSATIAGMFVPP